MRKITLVVVISRKWQWLALEQSSCDIFLRNSLYHLAWQPHISLFIWLLAYGMSFDCLLRTCYILNNTKLVATEELNGTLITYNQRGNSLMIDRINNKKKRNLCHFIGSDANHLLGQHLTVLPHEETSIRKYRESHYLADGFSYATECSRYCFRYRENSSFNLGFIVVCLFKR